MRNLGAILHGDFFKLEKRFAKDTYDLILTDPPYNRLQKAGQDWDTLIDWAKAEEIFARLLKPFGQLIIYCDLRLAVELVNTESRQSNSDKIA